MGIPKDFTTVKKYKKALFYPTSPDFSLERQIIKAERPIKCTYCNSKNIKPNGKALDERKFTHVKPDGKFVEITWLRPQSLCCDCGKRFLPEGFDLKSNNLLTQQAMEQFAKIYLSDPHITYKDISDKTGLNISTIGNIINSCIKQISPNIEFRDFPTVIYLPFEYQKQKICALVGIDQENKKAYLLDIWKHYSIIELRDFHEKHFRFCKQVSLSLVDLDKTFLKEEKLFSNYTVGIIFPLLIDTIDFMISTCRSKKQKEILNILSNKVKDIDVPKEKYTTALIVYIRDYTETFEGFIRNKLDTISTYATECWNGKKEKRWLPEYSELYDILHKFERSKCNFDDMKRRLLYANQTSMASNNNYEFYAQVCSVKSIFDPSQTKITDFAIDIQSLYDEFNNEDNIKWCFINEDYDHVKAQGCTITEYYCINNDINLVIPDYLLEIFSLYDEACARFEAEGYSDVATVQQQQFNLKWHIDDAEKRNEISHICAEFLKNTFIK